MSMSEQFNVLKDRLQALGLAPFDVGGSGDCFFKAVSHQLYSDPGLHERVRCKILLCISIVLLWFIILNGKHISIECLPLVPGVIKSSLGLRPILCHV